MSGADKFMPMFWGDYARDTGDLNNAGHGAYLMLIKHYWGTARPLPDDDAKLWRIACCDSIGAWKKLRPAISAFFKIGGGQWRHARVDRELVKAAERYEKRSKAGQKGNSTRWAKDGNAPAAPPPEPPTDDPIATDDVPEERAVDGPIATYEASLCDPNAIPKRSQPQPQPHLLTEKKATQLGPVLPAAPDDAQAEVQRSNDLIRAFDAAIVAVWGEAQARPWPTGTDSGTALRWLRAGVTADLVAAIAEPRFRRMASQRKARPGSLAFIDAAITETLAEAARQGLPPPGTKPDPGREAAARRYIDALDRWDNDGRQGQSPKPEDFGLKAVAA